MSRVAVGISEIAVAAGDVTLVASGLGSCVAIALYDAELKVGALAHVLLPSLPQAAGIVRSGKTPSLAVPAMLERMSEMGVREKPTATLVGGASMFASLLPQDAVSIGSRNVIASRLACAEAGVPVVEEIVGGSYGRSVEFSLLSGRIVVRTVNGDDSGRADDLAS